LVGLLRLGISPSQGQYLHRTAQNRKTRTHIHASSGIGTHYTSVRAVEERTCLRPRGHWDRPDCFIYIITTTTTTTGGSNHRIITIITFPWGKAYLITVSM